MEGRGCRVDKEEIFLMLAGELRKVFLNRTWEFGKLQEIRLRVNCPVLVVYDGREYCIEENGSLGKRWERGILVTSQMIRETLEYVSNYSMYAFEEELRQGYITVRGGHRIGVAGKMVMESGSPKTLQNISFLNIRLAHEVLGCSNEVMPFLIQKQRFCHSLIISPPGCGKTTLLRDIVRQLSNGVKNQNGVTVGVVDERSEIGACYQGRPQNDLGSRTDVLDGCSKVKGMMMLVRSMAPRVIAVDEVGSREDVEAMEYVMNCGVGILATVHGNSVDEVKSKPVLGRMVQERAFERYIVLQPGVIGQIQAVFDARGSLLFSGQHDMKMVVEPAC